MFSVFEFFSFSPYSVKDLLRDDARINVVIGDSVNTVDAGVFFPA